MNSNQILTAVLIIVAILATFMADAHPYWGLALVTLGLINGFMNPFPDMTTRMAYTVAVVAIPTIANGLDAIPVVGAPINGVIDQVMLGVGGAVIANFLLVIKDQIMPSSE